MKPRPMLFAILSLLLVQVGCRNASFQNIDNADAALSAGSGDAAFENKADSGDEQPNISAATPASQPTNQSTPFPTTKGGDPTQNTNPTQTPVKAALTVATPSPDIKAGGEDMPATATLSNQTEPPLVTWSISGPAGKADIGTIDPSGIYSSPEANDTDFPLTIIATLIADPSVIASTVITVLPKDY